MVDSRGVRGLDVAIPPYRKRITQPRGIDPGIHDGITIHTTMKPVTPNITVISRRMWDALSPIHPYALECLDRLRIRSQSWPISRAVYHNFEIHIQNAKNPS